jgi:hypothetical protein
MNLNMSSAFTRCAVLAWLALAAGTMLVGCGSGGGDETPSSENQDVAEFDLSTAGTISGTALFEGDAPAPEMFDASGDSHCLTHLDGDEIAVQPVEVHDGKLANVFVYISSGLEGTYKPINENPVLYQKGCTYHPHVLGVVLGQPLTVRNDDETLHNVHIRAKVNEEENFGQPNKGMTREVVFDKVETPILFKCDVHGWMKSYVFALPHPAFGITGSDGSFSFRAPPGEYTLTAWHETLGTKTATVTVTEGGTVETSFTFGAPADTTAPVVN